MMTGEAEGEERREGTYRWGEAMKKIQARNFFFSSDLAEGHNGQFWV